MSSTPTPVPEPTLLNFEEFTHANPMPRYNNLILYFLGNGSEISTTYREKEYFKRFQQEFPDLEQKLQEGISALPYFSTESIKPFNQDLYQAYKIMRRYGASDQELFA